MKLDVSRSCVCNTRKNEKNHFQSTTLSMKGERVFSDASHAASGDINVSIKVIHLTMS